GWAVSALDFSADGATLAMSSEGAHDSGVTLWDVSKKQVMSKRVITHGVNLRFLRDGNRLAVCDGQSQEGAKLWDLTTLEQSSTLKVDKSNPFSTKSSTLSPDGKILALGDWNSGIVQLWDTRTERHEGTLVGKAHMRTSHNFYAFMGNSAVDFSPDG